VPVSIDEPQAANRPRELRVPSGARLVEAEGEVVEVGVEHVAVDAQREAGVGVPKHGLDGLGACTGGDHASCSRVTQDMDADRRQIQPPEHWPPDSMVEVREAENVSLRAGEEQRVAFGPDIGAQVPLELMEERGRKGHLPLGVRLGRVPHEATAHLGHRPLNQDATTQPVDGPSLDGDRFPIAKPEQTEYPNGNA
jgi:hypothetical protein